MKVTTTKLKNIQDKDLYYVTISNELGTKRVNINVGQKTYDAVREIEEVSQKTIEQAEIIPKHKNK